MSPHVLIDEELDAMADPATPKSWQAMVLKLLTEMLADQRITICLLYTSDAADE